ncbi:MAG: hypothetical protein ACR2P8_14760, partial [Myxococcota bacterium]
MIALRGLGAPARGAAPLGPELAVALERPVPEAGLRVVVLLRRNDLPAAPVVRRERIRQRIDALTRPLRGGHFRPRRRFHRLGGFAGWLDRPSIDALRADPRVAAIYLERKVRLTVSQGTALVGADELQ